MLNQEDIQNIGKVVSRQVTDAIQEVIIPAMDKLEQELKQEIKGVENRLSTRIESINKRVDSSAKDTSGLQKRIIKLEQSLPTSAS